MPYLPEYNPDTNYQTQQSAPQSNIPPDQGQIPVGPSIAAPQEEPLVVGGDSPPKYSPATLESRSTRFKYGLGDLLQKKQRSKSTRIYKMVERTNYVLQQLQQLMIASVKLLKS